MLRCLRVNDVIYLKAIGHMLTLCIYNKNVNFPILSFEGENILELSQFSKLIEDKIRIQNFLD